MEGRKREVDVFLGRCWSCIGVCASAYTSIRFWWWQFGAVEVTVTDKMSWVSLVFGCLRVYYSIINTGVVKAWTFWGLHSRMGGLLLGLWGVCWPRCRFGSFFQAQRVMVGAQLWWQKTFAWCSEGLFLESEGYQLHSNLYYRGLFWRWCSCYLLLPAHWIPLLFSHRLYRSWVSSMYVHNTVNG